jgi:Ras GTPase-activating-like protein IQGAP2/3
MANEVLSNIINTIEDVPYGIRWICKQIKFFTKVNAVISGDYIPELKHFQQRKYPDASDLNVTSLIGGFFMLRFVNPAIVNPQSYMLIDGVASPTTRRTLTYVR